jgi:hypothetical protein
MMQSRQPCAPAFHLHVPQSSELATGGVTLWNLLNVHLHTASQRNKIGVASQGGPQSELTTGGVTLWNLLILQFPADTRRASQNDGFTFPRRPVQHPHSTLHLPAWGRRAAFKH